MFEENQRNFRKNSMGTLEWISRNIRVTMREMRELMEGNSGKELKGWILVVRLPWSCWGSF